MQAVHSCASAASEKRNATNAYSLGAMMLARSIVLPGGQFRRSPSCAMDSGLRKTGQKLEAKALEARSKQVLSEAVRRNGLGETIDVAAFAEK
jgi:hypothetical protein